MDSEMTFEFHTTDFQRKVNGTLGLCQTSGLAAAGAKRVSRRGTAFERVYIDSYVKRWLMSHGRSTRLTAAGETHFPT